MSGDGPVPLDLSHIGMAAFLLLINGGVSMYLELHLEKRILMGAIRAFCQLMLLGYILVPIFKANNAALTLVYALFMASVASVEASKRSPYGYQDMLMHTMAALSSVSALVLTYALAIVIAPLPWWQAQYLIPIFGMLLGNTTSGISVGLSTTLTELAEGKAAVEAMLALGATRWEACRALLKKAITLGTTPILNQMSIIGVVSIPGMMTGQILGGTAPEQAARYQCIIIFLIAATTCMGTVIASLLAVYAITDSEDRVRSERLILLDKSESIYGKMAKEAVNKHVVPHVKPRVEAAKSWVTSRPLVQDAMHKFQRLNTDVADL